MASTLQSTAGKPRLIPSLRGSLGHGYAFNRSNTELFPSVGMILVLSLIRNTKATDEELVRRL
jgi:hypothetical protein